MLYFFCTLDDPETTEAISQLFPIRLTINKSEFLVKEDDFSSAQICNKVRRLVNHSTIDFICFDGAVKGDIVRIRIEENQDDIALLYKIYL